MIVTNYKIVFSDYTRLDGVKPAAFLLETDTGVVNLECSVNCEVGSEAELTTRLLMDAKRHLNGCRDIGTGKKRSLFEAPVQRRKSASLLDLLGVS